MDGSAVVSSTELQNMRRSCSMHSSSSSDRSIFRGIHKHLLRRVVVTQSNILSDPGRCRQGYAASSVAERFAAERQFAIVRNVGVKYSRDSSSSMRHSRRSFDVTVRLVDRNQDRWVCSLPVVATDKKIER